MVLFFFCHMSSGILLFLVTVTGLFGHMCVSLVAWPAAGGLWAVLGSECFFCHKSTGILLFFGTAARDLRFS